ncbi:lipopolysaccharide biosynthesis protein [Alteromonas gracilis]|uniref:oligosaccharide flippase family protein n=1 Tax=Alteromonas gracilis TaxID=1479524 RepID=UPI0036F2EE5F
MIAKKALLFSTSSEVITRIVSLISVALFARLLTPEELGIFIIASSIMFIASEVRMLGTHTFLIRESSIDQSKVSSAIGLAMAMSWSLAIIFSLLSPFLASFYGNSDIAFLIILLTISFYVTPYTSTTNALLSRELQFQHLFVLQVLPPAVSLTTSVVLVYAGLSYESLAIGQAVSAIFELVLSRVFRPKNMSWVPSFKGFKELLSVGVYTSLINFTNRLSDIIPDLILGKTRSAGYVAIVSRAIGLQLFMRDILLSGVSKIALPYLSLESRQNKNLKEYFLNATNMIAVFVIPPIAAGSIAAEALIDLLFGEQWVKSVVLAELLGVWMVIKCLHYFAQPVLFALKAEANLFWTRALSLAVLACLLYVTSNYGLIGIGISFIVTAVLDFFLYSYLLKKHLELELMELPKKIWKSLVVGLLTLFCAILIREYCAGTYSSFVQFFIYFSILSPVWIILVFILNHPIKKHLCKRPVIPPNA